MLNEIFYSPFGQVHFQLMGCLVYYFALVNGQKIAQLQTTDNRFARRGRNTEQ